MEKVITLTTQKPEYIYIVYSEEGCYLQECKTLVEVAKFFGVSKQAITNHLRRSGQSKNMFTYQNCTIEYFDINEEF